MEEKKEVFTAIQDAIGYLKVELNPQEGSDFILNVFFYSGNGRKSILSADLVANEEWSEDEEPVVNIFFKIDYEHTSEGYEFANRLQNFLSEYFSEQLKESFIKTDLNEELEGNEKSYLLKVSVESILLSSLGVILTMAIKSIFPHIPDTAVNIDILDNEYSLIERFYEIIK